MFKKLVAKLKHESLSADILNVTSPFSSGVDSSLKNMSKHALHLYERQTDINNFTKLVLSDPENQTHNEIVDNLFRTQNMSNPFSDEALSKLSQNKNFLKDLGLD